MKLAEALVRRADSQKKIAQLRQRLERVVKVQEGETPAEDPTLLLAELEQTLAEQTSWVRKINKTNAATPFNAELSISDALAERDRLMQHRKLLAGLLEQASIKQDRFSRSEVRFERTVDVVQLQARVDALSKAYREMDFRIQEMNWTTELIET
ncbi:DIP1984 family protein [Cohnella rhizosphaerae]|uniref:DIP1984 family protein n=1 Tax=Cohnella rhizosphaerae TaxID=1457232 RepID=A0A9X4QSM4_9BACL|nr:DIP1984 family protein [Cohnella rhizosphaerae]MDG0809473.1 DIP1984 family protein [Cohnella rhizosphaerae]